MAAADAENQLQRELDASNSCGCCDTQTMTFYETNRLQGHRPYGITAAVSLPNGVKATASSDGTLNVWDAKNVLQYTTKVAIRPDFTERITALHVWDAWDETVPVRPRGGPRWFAVAVITHSADRWFEPRVRRLASRVVVWNVVTGDLKHLQYGPLNHNVYMAHVSQVSNFHGLLLVGCQDGVIIAWDPRFPSSPIALLNDSSYDMDATSVPSVLTGMHVVEHDESLHAITSGSVGSLLVAVLARGGVLMWDIAAIARSCKSGPPDAPPRQYPICAGSVGTARDVILDSAGVLTPACHRQEGVIPARHLIIALAVPAGESVARLRHFFVHEFFRCNTNLRPSTAAGFGEVVGLSDAVMEGHINFHSFSRLAVSPKAIVVAGTGLMSVLYWEGCQPWALDTLLDAASHDLLYLFDPQDAVPSGDSRPRLYQWFSPLLHASAMGGDAIVATSTSNGAKTSVFVRLPHRVMSFSTALTLDGRKQPAVLLDESIFDGQARVLVDAGHGDDDELDMFVGDSRGTGIILDTLSLKEPVRRVQVSLFDMLPSILEFLLITMQFSAFNFVTRAAVPWSASADILRYMLRTTLLDMNVSVDPGFVGLFIVCCIAVLAALLSATVYHRYEVLKPVTSNVVNNRFDDGPGMRTLWWIVWACTTILYLPISRVLLTPCDCTDGLWHMDPTGAVSCWAGWHTPVFIIGLLLWAALSLLTLRLSPVGGDCSQIMSWTDQNWVERQVQRLFLGPFTRNRLAAPVTGMMTAIVQILLAIGLAIYGRSALAVTIFQLVMGGFLAAVTILFPVYVSPSSNILLATGRLLFMWTSFCGVITVWVDDPANDMTARLVWVGWAMAGITTLLKLIESEAGRRAQDRAFGEVRSTWVRDGFAKVTTGYDPATHARLHINAAPSGAGAGAAGSFDGAHAIRGASPAVSAARAKLKTMTTVIGALRAQEPEFRFPQIKTWPPLCDWDPSLYAATDPWRGQAVVPEQAATHRREFPTSDPAAVRAFADATFAEHERDNVSLLARLDQERRRQRAKAQARVELRRAQQAARRASEAGAGAGAGAGGGPAAGHADGEQPLDGDDAVTADVGLAALQHRANRPGAAAARDEDVRAALEWVYAEHDAAVASLQARMQAERAEQRARLEARRKRRDSAHDRESKYRD